MSKETLLNNKYYYAGGSARWMFQFSYLEWKNDVTKHLQNDRNYMEGPGNKHARAVNHLRGMEMVNDEPVYFFISKYVGVQLAQKAAKAGSQHQFIADGYDVANRLVNPSLRGWIFEFDVDYQLRRAADAAQQGKKSLQVWVDNAPETWEVKEYFSFSSHQLLANKVAALTDKRHLWAKPAWRQAGYDFLHFSCVGETDIHLRVLNATYASRHNLFLDEINALLTKLINYAPDPKDITLPKPPRVTRVRFEFVIPHGDPKVRVAQARGTLVGWNNFQGEPWTQNIHGLLPHFVVVTELDCTGA